MIYICVLNYNNSDDTIACLESIKNLVGVEYRIVLVDNASTDCSREILNAYVSLHKDTKFIQAKENNGYAAGNNLAMKYALYQDDMEYCWILNNDTIVTSDSLKYLKSYMDENPQVGLCGSKLMYEWDRDKLQGYGGFYNPYFAITSVCKEENRIKDMDFVIGAACLVSRAFLETIGLMNEAYFLYYEEIDWAYRAKGKFAISCVPESIIYNKEGATIGGSDAAKNDKSLIADYYSLRNRIVIAKKYHPFCLLTVYIGLIISAVNRIRRRQYKRVFMIMKIMLGLKCEV